MPNTAETPFRDASHGRGARGGWGAGIAGTVALIALAIADGTAAQAAEGATLQEIQDRGYVLCGTTRSGSGVAELDETGAWRGFFPDFCRALGAAIFGDPDAVNFVEVDYLLRFEALKTGAFDVLMANTTWTVGRDVGLGLTYTNILYYDGQGFLAHRSVGARSLAELGEARVCVHAGTTTVRNLEELVSSRFPNLTVAEYASIDGVYDAFFSRECEILTQDRVALVAQRQSRAAEPADYVLFPDVVSKEPLGPVVRDDDRQWEDIVRWVANALILAEEHGLTSAGVAEAAERATDEEVQRLLGTNGEIGAMLGLPADWALRAIAEVGNFGEVFERNLGVSSGLGVERGLNALWSRGGLIYAPPLR